MKKTLVAALLVISVLALGGILLYRLVMPGLVAQTLVSESLPGYIPKRLKAKVESIRKPLNNGTQAMLEKMYDADISLDQVLRAVDNISEDEAYAFLDELNTKKPTNTNEVFDLAKKHFSTDFDPEVFREPFNKHIDIKQVKKAVVYANLNRRSNDIDITTAKAIVKQIIIEKEKELKEIGIR